MMESYEIFFKSYRVKFKIKIYLGSTIGRVINILNNTEIIKTMTLSYKIFKKYIHNLFLSDPNE